VPPQVIEHTRQLVERGKQSEAEWEKTFQHWAGKKSADVELYERLQTRTPARRLGRRPPDLRGRREGLATRKARGEVINAIAAKVPELWGGSADLAESNNTTIEGAVVPARRTARPSCGRATRTPAGCCTSASASTPWARS
jgi:transketolase